MKNKILISVAFVIALMSAHSQTPTRWRGPQGNGVYSEINLLNSWPANGPDIIWTYTGLGQGFSSVAIQGGYIYMSSLEGKTGYIHKIDLQGNKIWEKTYGNEWNENFNGSRSTPVIDGDYLFMYTGYGVLVKMNTSDGGIVWKKDFMGEFSGENIRWGVTETVVVDDKNVYATPGGKENNVVAVDKISGEFVWTSKGLGEKSAYCTPLLITHNGMKKLITMTENHIMAFNADNGTMLWSYEQKNQWSVHANTPIYDDGGLLCFSGYGKGAVRLQLGSNNNAVSLVWENKEFDSRMGGAVLINGYVYGSGDKAREWRCLDWKTGVEKWVSKEIGKGVVVAADNKLYLYSEKGELALVRATPDKFELLSTAKVELGTETHWAHPVIFNGILYIRHGDTLIAYKIK